MNTSQKFRVTIDLPKTEREMLQRLCDSDYRPPDDQIRWLIVNAAKRRGLCQSIQATLTQLPTGTTPEQI